MGHADPFAFDDAYRPAPGILRFLTGTPSILALAALDAGLSTFEGVAMHDLAAKSRRLSELFVTEVESRCGSQLRLESPRDPHDRGSHVVFAHPHGYAVMQALIERGVIGDFRAPGPHALRLRTALQSLLRNGVCGGDPRCDPRYAGVGSGALSPARKSHLTADRSPCAVHAPRPRTGGSNVKEHEAVKDRRVAHIVDGEEILRGVHVPVSHSHRA